LPWLEEFLGYRKLEPDLADGMLVYLAEREDIPTIFSVDQRDFSVYRYARTRRLRIIPAPVR
jgi:predicted nucleic acid-binding protein